MVGPVVVEITAPEEKTTMTVEKLRPTVSEIKSLLAGDADFLKPLVGKTESDKVWPKTSITMA